MNEIQQNKSMVPEKSNTEILGIHSSVIASIVKKSALAVPGVVRLADGSIVDNLTEMVGTGKSNMDRSITVETTDKATAIGVRVVIDIHCHAAETARAVQQKVAENVEVMTGLKIKEVSVMVMDFEDTERSSSGLL